MDAYRKFALFLKGLIYETKNGFVIASRSFDNNDVDVDVTGQVFMISGANSGIGYSTARSIALKGGEVHMICRNPERAQKAKDSIVNETKNSKIHIHIVDLSRVNDVLKFADDFTKNHTRLDVLINNAGEMIQEFRLSEVENFEMNFATNVVGPAALTFGLIPLLKASNNNPRVVIVTSAGMLLQKLNKNYFDKVEKDFDGLLAYAQCKRQMTVLGDCWAAEHPEIHFSSMHPGWVDTPAARRGLGDFIVKMEDKFRNSDEGADTVTWLALSPVALAYPSGSYFQDRCVVTKHLFLANTKETKQERTDFYQFMTQTVASCKIDETTKV
ncbi:dehydrogenase/reductase SDR family member 12-like [Clavelina lepadiformis]|uniref:dehydrogenase/reductase SDR family member 12-like n=1 Tax=Clavelina lepadiformis TaxID=159417 RepID=UPI004042417B